MDQIFYVNSASFVDVSITSSLVAGLGSNIDFSQATQVSGSFVGLLSGTASYASVTQTATSASHSNVADTSSVATTAATSSYVVGQKIKSGIVSGSSFGGNPQTASVVFTTPFPSLNYSVSIVGDTARSWLVQNKTTASFQISANTKTTVTGFVYWIAIMVGEFNS